MQVTTGIHRIEAPLGERYTASYLLQGDRTSVLVDTGIDPTARDVLLPALRAMGVDPSSLGYVVSTHCDFDHTGGNAAVRAAAPRAIFLAGKQDREQVEDVDALIHHRYGEFRAHGNDESPQSKELIRRSAHLSWVDLSVCGGERIHLAADWQVELLHTPGHSRGSISVFDPRSGAVIVGDAVLADSVLTADGRPAFPPTYRYVDDYLSTIQLLTSLQPELLLTSHYPVMHRAEAADFLARTRRFVDAVDARVRAELSTGAQTLVELSRTIAADFGPWDPAAAAYMVNPVFGHLERLIQHGLAVLDDTDASGGRLPRWRLTP